MNRNTNSWGRLKRVPRSLRPYAQDLLLSARPESVLPFGNGRSYGDSCLNDQGTLLASRPTEEILDFDPETGVLHAQSGVLLGDILTRIASEGWFLPVVPGTRFVTLGGAIANDIHGKNHMHQGTFGAHVLEFGLARSDHAALTCSPQQNAELFCSTIGGMGLTGFITDAKIQLMQVPSHYVEEQIHPFASLEEFVERNAELESENEYCVAWVDSLAKDKNFGRGLLITGNHVASDAMPKYAPPILNVPVTPPFPLVAGVPLRAFNWAYRTSKSRKSGATLSTPAGFFFPLDAIGGWNRLYGPKGLFQHQSVVPDENALVTLKNLIATSQNAGQGSFLTVLKRFGEIPSPSPMSFPMRGYTLTLDFPNRGAKTLALLEKLDAIVLAAGGRINPYKDARMSAETFKRSFPDYESLEQWRDPAITSDFWERVSGRVTVSPPSLETPSNNGHLNQPVNQNPKPRFQEPHLT
ncbi:MAG: FAD-binding oxidoreductase [Pseudomonadota bacterium]